MKSIRLLMLAVLTGWTVTASAQIDNLVNMSSEWVRISSRNAALDAADIVVYNPAGITSLENGFHINASNQFVFRKPSHQYDIGLGEGQRYSEQQSADPFLPNFYMTYKKDKWALFTGAFISAGGAGADYSQGSITTDLIGLQALSQTQGAYLQVKNPSFKATSYYLTTTLGGSYALTDKVSIAAAIRYINAKNTTQGGITLTSSPFDLPDLSMNLDAAFTASGVGEVLSICVKPTEKLTVTGRYETQVKLDFETETKTDDFGATVNGEKNRRDLSSVIALGVAYNFNDKVRVLADVNYYAQTNADWGKSSELTENKPLSELAGNSGYYSTGVEYKFSDKLVLSTGVGYTDFAYQDKSGYYTSLGTFEVVPDDNWNINAGFKYRASDVLSINAGCMQAIYKKNQHVKALNAYPMDVDVTINNAITIASIGVNLTF